MKVNMNQEPEKNSRKTKTKPDREKPVQAEENVYKESLKMYADKFKEKGLLRQNKFWIVLIVALFFVFLSVNSKMTGYRTQLTVKTRRAAAETQSLNDAIEEVKADLEEQARIDSLKMTKEEEEMAKNNAIEQGTKVAEYQNAYRHLDFDKDYDAYQSNKDALDICFGPNDKNSRVEWYDSFAGIPGSWEFASKAPFSGKTAKVLWLCYSDDGRMLLSYCTASYNADTKLFTNVKRQMTGYAQANLKTDGYVPTEAEETTSICDMLDNMKSTADPSEEIPEEEIPEEVTNELFNSREQLKDAARNNGEFDENHNIGLGNSDESQTDTNDGEE